MFKQCKFVSLSLLLMFCFSLHAQSNSVEIRHARINTTIPGTQTTAAYFNLINPNDNDLVLKSLFLPDLC